MSLFPITDYDREIYEKELKDFLPERMLDIHQAERLYKTMGKVFQPGEGRSYYIISPHEQFEHLFGRPANRRRKLYNGMLKCQLFMFF